MFLVPLVVFWGVKFGFRKSCLCKKNDKYKVWSGPNKLTPLVQLIVLTHLAFTDNFSILKTYVGVAFGDVACSTTLMLMVVFNVSLDFVDSHLILTLSTSSVSSES